MVIANNNSAGYFWWTNSFKPRFSSCALYIYYILVTRILGISAFYHDSAAAIIKNGEIGEKYNIGGDCELEIVQIVNKICEILDTLKPRENRESYSKLIKFVDDRPGHDYRYAVDFNKITSSLGWSPQINFEAGIKETIKWYIENSSWWESIISNKYKLERLGQTK